MQLLLRYSRKVCIHKCISKIIPNTLGQNNLILAFYPLQDFLIGMMAKASMLVARTKSHEGVSKNMWAWD